MRARTLKGKRQWADATINRHFAFLRHILTLAVQDGLLHRNPVSGVKFFPEARRTRFLSDAELNHLQEIMSADDWKIVAFAVETGLRRGEQFQLRWDHVDLENGILTMPLPKGGRTRHVPLSELAKELIRSLDSFVNSPWVFPGLRKVGKPMDSRAFLRRAFEPALKRAGIQGACWHTLRHTAASRRIMNGVDLVSVKELLGHRDIQTTYRYSHLSPEHLKDAINRGSLKPNRDQNRDQKEAKGEKESQVIECVVRPTGLEPVTPRSVVLYDEEDTLP
jgi:integrase